MLTYGVYFISIYVHSQTHHFSFGNLSSAGSWDPSLTTSNASSLASTSLSWSSPMNDSGKEKENTKDKIIIIIICYNLFYLTYNTYFIKVRLPHYYTMLWQLKLWEDMRETILS